jgi:hypothetical protein
MDIMTDDLRVDLLLTHDTDHRRLPSSKFHGAGDLGQIALVDSLVTQVAEIAAKIWDMEKRKIDRGCSN